MPLSPDPRGQHVVRGGPVVIDQPQVGLFPVEPVPRNRIAGPVPPGRSARHATAFHHRLYHRGPVPELEDLLPFIEQDRPAEQVDAVTPLFPRSISL